MPTLVTEPGFADPAAALAHFERRLGVETDCSDVHESLKAGARLRAGRRARPEAVTRAGHVPGAVNIPHRTMTAERMAQYPQGHRCSSSIAPVRTATAPTRRAIRLARLGYRVKEMIGGITGWRDEDFALERDAEARAA